MGAAIVLAALVAVGFLYESVKLFLKRYNFWVFVRAKNCSYPKPLARWITLPFGIDHKLKMLASQPEDLFDRYYLKKYRTSGPTHAIYDSVGTLKAVHSIEPANLKAALAHSFPDWTVSKSRRNVLYPLAQSGILTTTGNEWMHNRKFFHRHLHSTQAKDVRLIEPDVKLFFEAIGPVEHDGWTRRGINLSILLQRLTLDLSTKLLFGVSADAQISAMPRSRSAASDEKLFAMQDAMTKYADALQLIRHTVTTRGVLGSGCWLWGGSEYAQACAYLQEFTVLLVNKGKEDARASGLMKEMYAELRDPIQVRENLLELLLGGQNMTSSVLEWALIELADHPELYAQLREEIIQSFGPENGSISAELTWQALKKCQTLQNVINETLRCYPPLGNISKTAAADTVLPRGGGIDGRGPIAVSKGSTFTCNVYLMHRREEYWGVDAWEWKPDRWIGRKTGPEFAPFGGGPRICIGRELSLSQMSYILARFVQHFEEIRAPIDANNHAMQYRPVLAPKMVRLCLKHLG